MSSKNLVTEVSLTHTCETAFGSQLSSSQHLIRLDTVVPRGSIDRLNNEKYKNSMLAQNSMKHEPSHTLLWIPCPQSLPRFDETECLCQLAASAVTVPWGLISLTLSASVTPHTAVY